MGTVSIRPEESRAGSRRGGAARAALYAHVVEGQLCTTAQIARRLGISPDAAYQRIKKRPHPLTWDSLATKWRKAA
ncbi:hypothetical protein [Stenotrophomonas acidaminiphila]|uniref:hypothetical protein n=1 Tax=Stenotrophomonas acidaminiphila TaxID=128780 RepID=UPI0028ADAE6D|nr:hypothetical protein [Stenotrophomonas acidaminiphila]